MRRDVRSVAWRRLEKRIEWESGRRNPEQLKSLIVNGKKIVGWPLCG